MTAGQSDSDDSAASSYYSDFFLSNHCVGDDISVRLEPATRCGQSAASRAVRAASKRWRASSGHRDGPGRRALSIWRQRSERIRLQWSRAVLVFTCRQTLTQNNGTAVVRVQHGQPPRAACRRPVVLQHSRQDVARRNVSWRATFRTRAIVWSHGDCRLAGFAVLQVSLHASGASEIANAELRRVATE